MTAPNATRGLLFVVKLLYTRCKIKLIIYLMFGRQERKFSPVAKNRLNRIAYVTPESRETKVKLFAKRRVAKDELLNAIVWLVRWWHWTRLSRHVSRERNRVSLYRLALIAVHTWHISAYRAVYDYRRDGRHAPTAVLTRDMSACSTDLPCRSIR